MGVATCTMATKFVNHLKIVLATGLGVKVPVMTGTKYILELKTERLEETIAALQTMRKIITLVPTIVDPEILARAP